MSICNEGIHEDYTYGFLFYSKNKRIVLDDGVNEYQINAAEVLLEEEYVFIGELMKLDPLKIPGLRARIKSQVN
ncbi:hypothetical protein BK718_18920 [Bacillus thuringiensis serovar andalousiensis]|uniref:hypothetical protein n=1 Tax=Bacillus cereus group TaxID=86661 RepID=UPI0006AC965D|nr:hypothetical protein [Bacillus thuringiensis]MDA2101386.1 hypothetical protein [Bacillus cereus]MDA2106995.1 hypothetical protein [Bacillus cereus]OTX30776.1 hypothetical protein BK718_18920 [Bacillus thuringiensis serovar andalousiensis]OTY11411.1 hypothetical protein BK734_12540 [Bacillus thuringiensis serovar kim]OUB15145.1 hypothetical protein BK733_22065 [Bacillus thuringiensis serovar xiaguangiensis]